MQHAMQAAVSRPHSRGGIRVLSLPCPVLLGAYAKYSNANADTGYKAETRMKIRPVPSNQLASPRVLSRYM